MNLPFRLRLTLWFTGLFAAALVLFAMAIYFFMAEALVRNLDITLHDRINQVRGQVSMVTGRGALRGGTSASGTRGQFGPAGLISPSDQVLAGMVPEDLRLGLAHERVLLRPRFTTASLDDLRVATAPVYRGGTIVGYVLVWESRSAIGDVRGDVLTAMLVAGSALLALSGAGGSLLARRVLAPVRHVTQTAAAISARDLSQRVPIGSTHDELSQLATAFNAMIDRLEGAVERERRFTAEASHELRSPLAVIRAEGTLALERPRAQEEYERTLRRIDEQATVMEALIASLLGLARAETAHGRRVEEVPVTSLVASALMESGPEAQRTNVRIDNQIPSDLVVHSTPALLTRALRNLLDNAIRVSKAGDTVRIRAVREGTRIVVSVEDQGPGIAPEHQERIFDPFYQVASARTPGETHGLGLAISQRIVKAHGGTLAVVSTPGKGACFRIILPAGTVIDEPKSNPDPEIDQV